MEKKSKRSLQSRYLQITLGCNGRVQSEWIAALQNRFNIVARITVDAKADNDERDRILAPLRNRNTFLAKCFLLLLPGIVSLSPTNSESVRVSNFTLVHPSLLTVIDGEKEIFLFSLNLLKKQETTKKFAFSKISSRVLKCA